MAKPTIKPRTVRRTVFTTRGYTNWHKHVMRVDHRARTSIGMAMRGRMLP